MTRNNDMSLILTKAKKQGFFPDVPDSELDILEAEYRTGRNDVHPDENDIALGDSTMRRTEIVSSTITIATQALRLTFFTAKKTEVINTIRYTIGGTAAGATPTLCRIGLYLENPDLSLTLVASTPNDTALFSGSPATAFTKALSAAYTKIRGQRYAIGLLVVTAAATPTFYGSGSLLGAIASAEPKLSAVVSSQADLPGAIAAGSLAISGQTYYAEVLP